MLFRFSLYGFLKNQRYFEAFLVLVFMDKGLSFFQIGLLVGFRELMVNLFEIPSGAVFVFASDRVIPRYFIIRSSPICSALSTCWDILANSTAR